MHLYTIYVVSVNLHRIFNFMHVSLCLYFDKIIKVMTFVGVFLQIHRGRLEIFIHEVSRREAVYFKQRGIEESNAAFQNPSEYKNHYYSSKLNLSSKDEDEKRTLVKHYLEGTYKIPAFSSVTNSCHSCFLFC